MFKIRDLVSKAQTKPQTPHIGINDTYNEIVKIGSAKLYKYNSLTFFLAVKIFQTNKWGTTAYANIKTDDIFTTSTYFGRKILNITGAKK